MKIDELDEFNEMNDNNENKKKFFIHRPIKSLVTLNENIFKNILNTNSDVDSDTTDENSPIHKNIKIMKYNFKQKKSVKFSKIEIIRVESYKKYNKNNEYKYNNNKQSNNDKCLIF